MKLPFPIVAPDPHELERLERNARRLATWKAQQPVWLEAHIQKHAFRKRRPCYCAICGARRKHVQSIVHAYSRAPSP